MIIQQMTDAECLAVLARTNVARLECAQNNQPYIIPIRVELDGGFLYGYATLGKKIEWMRQNPRVCLEVDDLTCHRQWTSVVVDGLYEEAPTRAGVRGPAKDRRARISTPPDVVGARLGSPHRA
ncbi:MAG: pyridoxamine 5'-phosphate oxidase family protein [Vicinamibacterales bacterium]